MIITIDPGHGQYDNVYPDGVHYEGTQMYRLGYKLYYKLKDMGFTVRMTRLKYSDNPSHKDRAELAKGADLFISLHSNACDNENVDRVVVIPTVTNTDPDFRAFCKTAGEKVKGILKCQGTTQIFDRYYPDTDDTDYYAINRLSVEKGCRNVLIMEHSFHTNPAKATLLCDDAVLDQIAAGEADSIKSFIDPETVPFYWGHDGSETVTYAELDRILKL